MIVGVIPARGGSKRIPGKNIRPFCGRPIIEYSIQAALKSNIFDRVVVSTDCQQIADVAKRSGAEVPFTRPPELANDFATTTPVVQHAIAAIESEGTPVDFACCIYGTAPFISPGDIQNGLKRLQASSVARFSLPVTTFPYAIYSSLKMKNESECEMFYPEHESTRSQDLPEAWHDAGQCYWASGNDWTQLNGGILSSRLIGLPIPRHRVQDIDTPEDWLRAELMFELLSNSNEL